MLETLASSKVTDPSELTRLIRPVTTTWSPRRNVDRSWFGLSNNQRVRLGLVENTGPASIGASIRKTIDYRAPPWVSRPASRIQLVNLFVESALETLQVPKYLRCRLLADDRSLGWQPRVTGADFLFHAYRRRSTCEMMQQVRQAHRQHRGSADEGHPLDLMPPVQTSPALPQTMESVVWVVVTMRGVAADTAPPVPSPPYTSGSNHRREEEGRVLHLQHPGGEVHRCHARTPHETARGSRL